MVRQMGRGNPQKSWLKLRHVIALAELIGLPKAAQLARIKRTPEQSTTIWETRKFSFGILFVQSMEWKGC